MLKRKQMKPQDVIVMFAIVLAEKPDWVIAEIANRACLSLSEAHAGIKRLEECRLLDPVSRRIIIAAATEFLLHGIKYVFPAETAGRMVRGMPTAHAAAPLNQKIISDPEDIYVWPCAYGRNRGIAISPLYKTVPDAAQKEAQMYEFLALTDAICIGRAREQEHAAGMLVERLERGRL